MEYVKLNNGVEMPILGFGVYQIPKEDTKRCVLDAIKVGYRSIDTAQSYFNESEVGDAILECGIPRSELFITTKVWIDNKAIGVSNFYPDRLVDMCLFERKVIPAVNQVETNPLNQQIKAQEVMEKYGVHIEAWAPFGEGRNNMFSNPTLKEIGNKYNKSVAQVILRWLIQRGVIVVCKSTHIDRMQENFDVFDFELSDEDMNIIKKLDSNDSLFFNHQDPNMVEWFDSMVQTRRENDDYRKEKKNF